MSCWRVVRDQWEHRESPGALQPMLQGEGYYGANNSNQLVLLSIAYRGNPSHCIPLYAVHYASLTPNPIVARDAYMYVGNPGLILWGQYVILKSYMESIVLWISLP